MQFQQTLREKREQFHIQIRSQQIEVIFQEKRNLLTNQQLNTPILYTSQEIIKRIKQNLFKLNEQQLENEIKNLQTKFLIEKQLEIQIYELIFIFNLLENYQNFSKQIISQILLLLYTTIQISNQEAIELLIQNSKILCQINQLIYNCTELELEIVDLLIINLENIGRKSEICLQELIDNKFIDTIKWMIEKIDVYKDEQCLLTIFNFLSIFVNFNLNKLLKEFDLILLITDQLCKKLYKVDYFSFNDFITNKIQIQDCQLKIAVITKLLTLLKYSFDKKGNLLDLQNYKNIKKVIWQINFSDQQLAQFQKITAYIINLQSQAVKNIVKKLLETNENLISDLFDQLNFCQNKDGEYEKIRLHSSISIRNFFSFLNQNIKQQYQEELIKQITIENSSKVMPYLLEIFYLLLKEQPNMQQFQLLEDKLKQSYEQQNWVNLKQILNCLQEMINVDEMKTIKESQTIQYLELLSTSGSKQIQDQALLLLNLLE